MRKIKSSIVIFLILSSFGYGMNAKVNVTGVLITSSNQRNIEILNGTANINSISEEGNTSDIIKVTVQWYDGQQNISQSNPLRFNTSACYHRKRLDLNQWKDKHNIYLSYGSGEFWNVTVTRTEEKTKYASAHYFDPATSELIYINLAYNRDKIVRALIFTTPQISRSLCIEFLSEFGMLSELRDAAFMQLINNKLFPNFIELE